MSSPSFYLPPCPVCSSLLHVDRPIWRFAHNASRARGRKCHIFVGCQHAAAVADLKIRDDPADVGFVEDAWARRAEELFEERTANWTPEARAGFRRAIEDRHHLPGAVDALPGLDAPAEPEPAPAALSDEERAF